MTPPFEIVDEEYIEELKYNSGKENTKKSTENILTGSFSKVNGWKKLPANLEGTRAMSSTKHCRSLSSQKFNIFALYVINK